MSQRRLLARSGGAREVEWPTGAALAKSPPVYRVDTEILARKNGFARRPLDNVGVQYGLAALNAGLISEAQFLDLNEKIGGLDIDANFIPERMVADRQATRAAYQTGKVIGGGPLGSVPILDVDVIYTDSWRAATST
jgi:Tannase-like family of unknown function (DUF6351)